MGRGRSVVSETRLVKTKNLNLNKPQGTDYVQINDLNENADIIDREITNVKGEVKTTNQSVDQLDGKVTKQGVEIGKVKENIKNVEGSLDELGENVKGLNGDIDTTKSELMSLGESFDEHTHDYVNHVGYGRAYGTNTYGVSLDPPPTRLVEGMGIVFRVTTTATGKCRLNVNGLGAKDIKTAEGEDVDDLTSGSVYTVRYNGSAFILQGKGGGSIDILTLKEKIFRIIGKDKLYTVNVSDGYMIVDGGNGFPNGMRSLDLNGTLIHSQLSFADAERYATHDKMVLFRSTADTIIVRSYTHTGTVVNDVGVRDGWRYDFGGMDNVGNFVLLDVSKYSGGSLGLKPELRDRKGSILRSYDNYEFPRSVFPHNDQYVQSGRFMHRDGRFYIDIKPAMAFYTEDSNSTRSYDQIGVPIFN